MVWPPGAPPSSGHFTARPTHSQLSGPQGQEPRQRGSQSQEGREGRGYTCKKLRTTEGREGKGGQMNARESKCVQVRAGGSKDSYEQAGAGVGKGGRVRVR